MNNIIRNRYGGRADANQLKHLFGLTYYERWPLEGIPPTQIEGNTLYVKPFIGVGTLNRFGFMSYPNVLRLMVVCNDCGRHMSYGRLHQHTVVHQG